VTRPGCRIFLLSFGAAGSGCAWDDGSPGRRRLWRSFSRGGPALNRSVRGSGFGSMRESSGGLHPLGYSAFAAPSPQPLSHEGRGARKALARWAHLGAMPLSPTPLPRRGEGLQKRSHVGHTSVPCPPLPNPSRAEGRGASGAWHYRGPVGQRVSRLSPEAHAGGSRSCPWRLVAAFGS
jgi:hypothetical protein